MKILVTGGAGYIGSHVVRTLQARGDEVVIVDDLSEGLQSRVGPVKLVSLDLASSKAFEVLTQTMKNEKIDAVVHLAARKKVGESVEKPEWYYSQNIGGQANLQAAMRDAGVSKLVFSSSAATYGIPEVKSVSEDMPCKPINPYGETKLIGELLVAASVRAWGMRGVSLRYFNVAGAGWRDLADTAVANLIPIVFAAIRSGQSPKIFGNDYATNDGSCVRDYVHVKDLADAHVAAIDYLKSENRAFDTFNVGTGKGSSVFEVLQMIHYVSGIDFKTEILPRRAGDPPFLCADVNRIKATLGWQAKYDLRDIVESAWEATA